MRTWAVTSSCCFRPFLISASSICWLRFSRRSWDEMRIIVLGAGPAGLYFALLAKKAQPSHRITVVERNPPDATYGWGVVFSEETLGALRDADRQTFDEITDTFAKWTAIDVRYRGETVRSRGHAFSAIARKRLLEILQARCAELGVELSFEREVADRSEEHTSELQS